ncbi:MAG: thioredoxin domain-containing protein [Anaerolineales bacterium]
MPNRLANENSPYLLQHKNNPVDWYPWGEEALGKAREEDKPIFLSIGYAACHWCHVMERESFEAPGTAAIMNEHFVSIKVDREERPDLDNIYMKAVVALTGQGGWPMSVFLTPDGEPFHGGTYFPPARRFNMPSFKDVLLGVANAWENDRRQVMRSGQQLRQHLQREFTQLGAKGPLSGETASKALLGLAQGYDWENGGWGRAPKFPQPMIIEFLLRRATRGDNFALETATHALDAMAKGGMYDVVGGGFARYSVDDRWLVPHFEKMLYDNAQLAALYLHAYLLTGKDSYRRVVEETLDFVAREMTHPLGGFYASLDADSEGEEGKFYVWTPAEIREALGDSGDADFLIAAYNITEAGNFEGRNILQRARDDESLAGQFGALPEQTAPRLKGLHARLLKYRSCRVRPGTDDKVLTSWNGLMLVAFSEAGRYLDRSDYTELAMRNADFLLSQLHPGDRLLRSWRDSDDSGKPGEPGRARARHNAYLEDYGALILGLLALYQTDPNPRWFTAAQSLAADMIAHFEDPAGGFFDTRDDHESLLVRPKDLQDNATPSGNALAATALLQLAAFTGSGARRGLAEESLALLQPAMERYPTAFGQWLCGLDFVLGPIREIAVLGASGPRREALLDYVWGVYRSRSVVAVSDFPPPPSAPSLLANRPLLDGKPTVYVCQGFICQQPVNTVRGLKRQLGSPPHSRKI